MKLIQRIKFILVGLLGSLLVRVLVSTLRMRVVGRRRPERPGGKAVIYCFWHSQLLSLAYLYRNQNIHVLVSSHRDGEYIVRITKRLGYGAVRGSSTRGSARLLSDALEALGKGLDIAITPDGPRGPRQQFKPGAIFLARESGLPIVLGACVAEHTWRLRSWDGFHVPKPFSRATLVVGDPIYIPRDLDDEGLEAKRVELERTLNEFTRRGEGGA